MISRFFIQISRFPKSTVTLTIICSVLFIMLIDKGLFNDNHELILDSSLEPFFSEKSGVYEFYQRTNQEFGDDQMILVALQPTQGQSFDLNFFLTLEEMMATIRSEVIGIKDVFGLTNVPRYEGSCTGDSYFHEESLGSTCESILENYRKNLECLQMPLLATPAMVDSLDLLLGLEDDPDLDMDDGPEAVSDCSLTLPFTTEAALTADNERKISKIFNKIKQDHLLEKDLLSTDYKTTALVLLFQSKVDPSSKEVQESLSRLLQDYRGPKLLITYAGQPRDEYESSLLIQKDILRILPISFLAILAVLLLSFRSFRGMLAPSLVVLIGLIGTVGFFVIFGSTLNFVTIILPLLLIAVGSTYIIHFMNQYFQAAADQTLSKSQIIELAITRVAYPITIATFTTLVGFAALMISPIPAVQQMGFYACLGIALIYFLTLSFAPSLLHFFAIPRRACVPSSNSRLDRLTSLLGKAVIKRSRFMLRAWALIILIAIIGVFQITVDSETNNFSADSQIQTDKNFIEENLAGMSYLRVILSSTGSSKSLLRAKTMYSLLELKRWLREEGAALWKNKGIRFDKIYTPVEYIDIDRQGLDNLTDFEVIKFFDRVEQRKGITFLNKNRDRLSITLRIKVDSSGAFLNFRDRLDEKVQKLFPDLKIQYTGSAMLVSESVNNITTSQLTSLALALILIFIILATLFRSVRVGLLALCPNLVSILIFFGFLGWFDIPIGLTISVIAAITLGIGVDDTIHFVTHYLQVLKTSGDREQAAQETFASIGRPMIHTTIALTCGFAVFALSEMESQSLFGMLSALTLGICLAADINLLPAILFRSQSLHRDQ